MPQIRQTNLLDMIELCGEDICQTILSHFLCPLNKDVEDFIHNKAIIFSKQHIAMTYLVFLEENTELTLIGYYTLANKFVSIPDDILSKTMQKRISKFSQYDEQLRRYLVSIPLIAQLGKNFTENTSNINFSGSDLLTFACERVI